MSIGNQAALDALLSISSGVVVLEIYNKESASVLYAEDIEAQHNVTEIPSFLFFKQGDLLATVGGDDLAKVIKTIHNHIPILGEPTTEDVPSDINDTLKPPADETAEKNKIQTSPSVPLSSKALNALWNSNALSEADPIVLPPPYQLNDALAHLNFTLLPQIQSQALKVSKQVSPVEPTLALYCPLEGGENVIDTTVKKLAEKTGAEVQVVDMAQIAAGRWGDFGETAAQLQLPHNPFAEAIPEHKRVDSYIFSKTVINSFKSFWESVIGSNPPKVAEESESSSSPPTKSQKHPRIVYLRGFEILSSSASAWFPALHSAVCARRASTEGEFYPTTILLGISPQIFHSISFDENSSCSCKFCHACLSKGFDESCSKERAERLKKLKEKWYKGRLLGDLPQFSSSFLESESTEGSECHYRSEPVGYFRSCIVASATRNPQVERAARQKHRKNLNELLLRMVVGTRGSEIESDTAPESKKDEDFTHGWGEKLVPLNVLRSVADRALGSPVILEQTTSQESRSPIITWQCLQDAWKVQSTIDDKHKAWMDTCFPEDNENKNDETKAVDEVIIKVKKMDLDEHERRLLGCIVDTVEVPTTFDNVHLPPETIDSVRSIVSLPLLYPEAFKAGILKQQAIAGILLFGPPGTGKTLVARALAKESGARMLAIKTSDIRDKACCKMHVADYLGETEKLVKSTFKLARRLKPCVIFIDEIDALMGSRAGTSIDNSARWHTSMLNEFMQEMDGLMASSVIVIGATNRPFDIDDAVLRRLPCRMLIDLPGEQARGEILKIMLRNDTLSSDVDIATLAKQTERFSGSDIKNLCVAAAMDALKEHIKLPWSTGRSTTWDESKKTKPTPTLGTARASTSTESSSGADTPDKPTSSSDTSSADFVLVSSNSGTSAKEPPAIPKSYTLSARHFTRALKEITPSSSEFQGSLSELRKWNSQFGTGARGQSQKTTALAPSYGNTEYPGSALSGLGTNGHSSYSASLLEPLPAGRYPSAVPGSDCNMTGLGVASTNTGYVSMSSVYGTNIPGFGSSAVGGDSVEVSGAGNIDVYTSPRTAYVGNIYSSTSPNP